MTVRFYESRRYSGTCIHRLQSPVESLTVRSSAPQVAGAVPPPVLGRHRARIDNPVRRWTAVGAALAGEQIVLTAVRVGHDPVGGLTAGSPFPAPVTTIAWRTAHVAAVNYLYWDHAFGSAMLTFDLEFPSNATEAVEWLAASQRPLLQEFGSLDDAALERPRRTNWGAEWPTRRIFKTLIVEQVHHGAEISLLRDLYRNRATLGGESGPHPGER